MCLHVLTGERTSRYAVNGIFRYGVLKAWMLEYHQCKLVRLYIPFIEAAYTLHTPKATSFCQLDPMIQSPVEGVSHCSLSSVTSGICLWFKPAFWLSINAHLSLGVTGSHPIRTSRTQQPNANLSF